MPLRFRMGTESSLDNYAQAALITVAAWDKGMTGRPCNLQEAGWSAAFPGLKKIADHEGQMFESIEVAPALRMRWTAAAASSRAIASAIKTVHDASRKSGKWN
eukprot:gnl/TRDRNA2_/TRDRNA2_119161_c0_seq1.p1 gnl/TRDRNA2_/TRDRNA2_119161_c0~~gnl/TRDRNA2_/TRDRNA2_119161_c0_seq1.p1  ORF type:complete len:103 (+),score=6.14 gnl/TRDRNA2_/TRDRNA2_119161_c0_seq1:18-326(+)